MRKLFLAVASAISFILSATTFLSIHLTIGLSLEISVVISVLLFFLIFLFVVLDQYFDIHGHILGPIRRSMQFALSSIVLDVWDENIEIDETGNAQVIVEIKGRARFGYLRWIKMDIFSTSVQPEKSFFPIRIVEVGTNRMAHNEILIDSPKYKRIKIFFGKELTRGERFHYRIEYRLQQAFFFGKEDYYMHTANHNERKANIRVAFPHTVEVMRTGGTIETEYGDLVSKHEPVNLISPQLITWNITRVRVGNSFKLRWYARLKSRAMLRNRD